MIQWYDTILIRGLGIQRKPAPSYIPYTPYPPPKDETSAPPEAHSSTTAMLPNPPPWHGASERRANERSELLNETGRPGSNHIVSPIGDDEAYEMQSRLGRAIRQPQGGTRPLSAAERPGTALSQGMMSHDEHDISPQGSPGASLARVDSAPPSPLISPLPSPRPSLNG